MGCFYPLLLKVTVLDALGQKESREKREKRVVAWKTDRENYNQIL